MLQYVGCGTMWGLNRHNANIEECTITILGKNLMRPQDGEIMYKTELKAYYAGDRKVYIIPEPMSISVPEDVTIEMVDGFKEQIHHKRANRDPSIGITIEDNQSAYNFTDSFHLMGNGINRKRAGCCRAVATDNLHSNSVSVSVGNQSTTLSQSKAVIYAKEIIKKATDKEEDVEMTTINIELPPDMRAIMTLINSVDYTITTDDLRRDGIPKGTARNIVNRLLLNGVIRYTGDMRGKTKVYTGSIPLPALIGMIGVIGRQ